MTDCCCSNTQGQSKRRRKRRRLLKQISSIFSIQTARGGSITSSSSPLLTAWIKDVKFCSSDVIGVRPDYFAINHLNCHRYCMLSVVPASHLTVNVSSREIVAAFVEKVERRTRWQRKVEAEIGEIFFLVSPSSGGGGASIEKIRR